MFLKTSTILSIFFVIVAISWIYDVELLPFCLPFICVHCDTMDGPVIKDAQNALEKGKVDTILKWVQRKDEHLIRKVFDNTLSVRQLNANARELADMYFFETLVRIHRAGEGAPFTGILPSALEPKQGIEEADKAVESGSVDALVLKISEHLGKTIRESFKTVMEKKRHINEGIDAGREYVASYVTFIHFVEKIQNAISAQPAHHEAAAVHQSAKRHAH